MGRLWGRALELLVAGFVVALVSYESRHNELPWELIAGLVLTAVTVGAARRSPWLSLTAATVSSMAMQFNFGGRVPLWPVLLMVPFTYLAGRRMESVRPALSTFLAVAGVAVPLSLAIGRYAMADWGAVAGVLLFSGVLPWQLGRYMRTREDLVRAGWERAEELELRQRIVAEEARLRERARIASDMHDSLGHELSLIALRAAALEMTGNAEAKALRENAAAATERLREIIDVLREDAPPVEPVDGDLAALIDRARRSGVEITFTDAAAPVDAVELPLANGGGASSGPGPAVGGGGGERSGSGPRLDGGGVAGVVAGSSVGGGASSGPGPRADGGGKCSGSRPRADGGGVAGVVAGLSVGGGASSGSGPRADGGGAAGVAARSSVGGVSGEGAVVVPGCAGEAAGVPGEGVPGWAPPDRGSGGGGAQSAPAAGRFEEGAGADQGFALGVSADRGGDGGQVTPTPEAGVPGEAGRISGAGPADPTSAVAPHPTASAGATGGPGEAAAADRATSDSAGPTPELSVSASSPDHGSSHEAPTAHSSAALPETPHAVEAASPAVAGARKARAGAASPGVADVVCAPAPRAVAAVPPAVAGARKARASAASPGVADVVRAPAPPMVERAAYRVVQEALTNVTKHAPGAPVTVRVVRGPAETLVEVRNGPPPAGPLPGTVSGGRGLAGLGERVRLLGGILRAGHRNGGFEVVARLPHAAAPGQPRTGRPMQTESARQHGQARRQVRRRLVAALVVPPSIMAGLLGVVGIVYTYQWQTSDLDPADYARLQPGQPRADIAALLPQRQRGDHVEAPEPAGLTCEYYGTGRSVFRLRLDAYRLCFADDRLVTKELLADARPEEGQP